MTTNTAWAVALSNPANDETGTARVNLPSLLLGLVFSTLVGAGFHLLTGGGAGRFLLDLVLGWAGFWAGHFLAEQTGLVFLDLGSLHLGPALGLSFIFVWIGYWLSLPGRSKVSR